MSQMDGLPCPLHQLIKGLEEIGSSPVAAFQLSFEHSTVIEESENVLQGYLVFQENLSNTMQCVCSVEKTSTEGAAAGDLELSAQPEEHEIGMFTPEEIRP